MIERMIVWLSIQTGNFFAYLLTSVGVRFSPSGRLLDSLQSGRYNRRDLADARRIQARLSHHADTAEEMLKDMCFRAVTGAVSHAPDKLDERILESSRRLCWDLVRYEGLFPIKTIDFSRQYQTSEMWELTRHMRRQLGMFEQPEKAQHFEQSLRTFVYNLVDSRLPSLTLPDDSESMTLSVPLHTLHTEPAEAIQAIGAIAQTNFNDADTFPVLGKKLNDNLMIASGIDPFSQAESRRPIVMPSQSPLSRSQLVETYLAGTPFIEFFKTNLTYTLPQSARFEHSHIVGGSGHGKTQLLQSLLLPDLKKLREGKASIVVIDSQGDLIRNIRQLAIVGEVPERVVLIDPNDIAFPPALNFFDFGLDRVDRYAPIEREILINGAIALYEYVFGALLGAELTQRQGVIFRYLARLMMVVPGATIHTLMRFMEEPETTRQYLHRLDPVAKHFFESQFYSKKFDDTRQQILTRLWGVLSNSVLARMFANERNKLNLFEAMNSGSLILINTAKELLKQDGCEIIGRFFIALICQAAQERAPIAEKERQDTFVYIDEAHDYFDESMENLLNQARKYKVGLVLAHQNLDQFETKLRSTVMASTSIKMVGGLSAKDAGIFAREMGCEVEFLQSIRKHSDHTEFACNVRNHTPTPISLTVPFGSMERQPKMTAERAAFMVDHNRARYCAGAGAAQVGGFDRRLDAKPLEQPELL